MKFKLYQGITLSLTSILLNIIMAFPVFAGCVGDDVKCERGGATFFNIFFTLLLVMDKVQVVVLITIVVLLVWFIYRFKKRKKGAKSCGDI